MHQEFGVSFIEAVGIVCVSELDSIGLGLSEIVEKLQPEQCLVTLGNDLFSIYFPLVGDRAWLLTEFECGCFLKNVIFSL